LVSGEAPQNVSAEGSLGSADAPPERKGRIALNLRLWQKSMM